MALVWKQSGNCRNGLATVVAGTPIPLADGNDPLWIEHLFVQMRTGGSSRGLVYRGVPPGAAAADISTVCGPPAEMSAASSDGPGGSYEYDPGPNGCVDLRTFAVDGLNTGDTIMIDARVRN